MNHWGAHENVRRVSKYKIDTDWFLKKLGGRSILEILPRMRGRRGRGTMDYASLYRLIHGEREILLREAKDLAVILDVSLDELGRHAGL